MTSNTAAEAGKWRRDCTLSCKDAACCQELLPVTIWTLSTHALANKKKKIMDYGWLSVPYMSPAAGTASPHEPVASPPAAVTRQHPLSRGKERED